MTEATRCERTERLLAARLDAAARAAAPAQALHLLELACVATENAVAFGFIDRERAEQIWVEARLRHPELRGRVARAA